MLTAKELAQELDLNVEVVQAALDRLEKAGLVAKQPNAICPKCGTVFIAGESKCLIRRINGVVRPICPTCEVPLNSLTVSEDGHS
jgi:DNA-binding MarR family transcriptional regulator